MERLRIIQLPVGPLEVFCYIVYDQETGEGIVIDPAGEPEKILKILKDNNITLKYIINTHAHADHTAENQVIREATGAPVVMHRLDDEFSRTQESIEWNRKLGFEPPPPADICVEDGSELSLRNFTVRFIHTPGHTPGSCCILVGNNLFTGDTLFVGAVGRTDLPGSSFQALLESLKKLLDLLPTETVIWPGHDYGDTPTSTLGAERETNPYITDFLDE
ncbi:MAG: MBL fold metallo-hydrolase [Thermodesulforhabdaceae bacterium]|jgi:glyoxylase-like metal-dependent hydrolase (beta-lactamase superfamily II)